MFNHPGMSRIPDDVHLQALIQGNDSVKKVEENVSFIGHWARSG